MKELIESLETEIRKIGQKNIRKDGFYKISLVAAFVKSYEFLKIFSENEDQKNVYFLLGSLRGICEDYIFLTFLGRLSLNDRNSAVSAYMNIKVQEALIRQKAFFGKERKFQPVLHPTSESDNLISAYKQELKDIGGRTGLWSNNTPMPKIINMAESLGLKDFYHFFYTLSSETVHFNPRVLLRMGWSKDKDMENFEFSTRNFSKYYSEYGKVYASILFIKICHEFKDLLGLSNEFIALVASLESRINEILRWPEPVTYEEMNKEGPKDFMRILLKITTD